MDNLPECTVRFPLPENKWEAELALRALDMALVLYDFSMQRSYHKHVEDAEEYAFWERFSDEVVRILEDRGLFELTVTRME